MSALEVFLNGLARQIKMPLDVLKGGFMLTSAYFFTGFFVMIPSRFQSLCHLFSVIASCTLYLSLFSLEGFVELLGMCLLVYIGARTFRSNPWMPWLLFFYAMSHFCIRLFIVQILTTNAKKFDATTPMMVLVIKLTSFAWNVYDGSKPEKEIIPELRSKTVKVFPALLEFFGFVFFFASFLVGPAFDFNDYREYISGQGVFSKPKSGKQPSRILPALKAFIGGVICMGVFIKFSKDYSYDICATREYAYEWPYWKRFLFMQTAGLVARSKFYTAWLLSEGACNLVGIGFSGYDAQGKPTWTRARNVSIIGFELAQNPKLLIDAWNMRTGAWLKNCVYLRLVKPGEKPGTLVTFTTFLVSALWHGFHLGYYLTFTVGALYSMVGRTLRRTLRPIFVPPSKLAVYKPIYDFLSWFTTWTCINFIAAPFALWSLDKSLIAWSAVGWYALAELVVVLVVMDFLGGARYVRKLGKRFGADYGGAAENIKFQGSRDTADQGVRKGKTGDDGLRNRKDE
ncbi:lysophospholipid acyltransferase [Entophlyctis luteolus]|nr:lysophospholipid acyltransferase [Entophlyctis luteolus]KAJ3392353.1 lysophospholipid acyltransferase [Entophlyctis sp. JEL0112]